ncbi:MAG: UMP kinase [Elusimicrobiota bacterium]|jgi:uridylate kinase|nr:UMP kinase [Elusimicrobiota bacterium]
MPRRVVLKLSGETLCQDNLSISSAALEKTAGQIKTALTEYPTELAIVIGAGNLWRGAKQNMDRVWSDKIGMLATLMNAMALKNALSEAGLNAKVFCAKGVSEMVELYDQFAARDFLASGGVAVLAGGTGSPYFTTDTGAVLRAAELNAAQVLKATQIDGVYTDDPKKNPQAKKFDKLTFSQALAKHLKIMDETAFALCMETNIEILVFDFYKAGNLSLALSGGQVGTLVTK